MPFLNFGANKNKYCNLSDMNFLWKIWKIDTRIRIHFGPGSGSTYSKFGSGIRIQFSQMWIPGSGSTSKLDGSEMLFSLMSVSPITFVFSKPSFTAIAKKSLFSNIFQSMILKCQEKTLRWILYAFNHMFIWIMCATILYLWI